MGCVTYYFELVWRYLAGVTITNTQDKKNRLNALKNNQGNSNSANIGE